MNFEIGSDPQSESRAVASRRIELQDLDYVRDLRQSRAGRRVESDALACLSPSAEVARQMKKPALLGGLYIGEAERLGRLTAPNFSTFAPIVKRNRRFR
jgi:hypothetical protein